MKLTEILASAIIMMLGFFVVLAIFIQLNTHSGCGCLPSADITVQRINDSTGSYIKMTWLESDNINEIRDFHFDENYLPGNDTSPTMNMTLKKGASYQFPADPGPRHIIGIADVDGLNQVVFDTTI